MPVRVMHVVRPADGGIREHVRHLAWGMPPGLVKTFVAGPSDSPLFRQLPSWVTRCDIPVSDRITPKLDLQAAHQLRKLIQEHNIDVLHVHGSKSAFIGWLSDRLQDLPVKIVYTVHNFVEPKGRVTRGIHRLLEHRMDDDVDMYITVSHALHTHLQQYVMPDSNRVRTIHNGVHILKGHRSRKQIRQLWEIPESLSVVGTIARLIPEKGIDVLIDALRGMDDVFLVVIGDGPQRQELMERAQDVPSMWMGWQPDAGSWLPGIDLYVQPSRREGFGMSVVEAMMHGLPVIASQTGGLTEIIHHGRNGLLVPPDNSIELAAAIQRCISQGLFRKKLATFARAYSHQYFTVARMVRDTWQLYKGLSRVRS